MHRTKREMHARVLKKHGIALRLRHLASNWIQNVSLRSVFNFNLAILSCVDRTVSLMVYTYFIPLRGWRRSSSGIGNNPATCSDSNVGRRDNSLEEFLKSFPPLGSHSRGSRQWFIRSDFGAGTAAVLPLCRAICCRDLLFPLEQDMVFALC